MWERLFRLTEEPKPNHRFTHNPQIHEKPTQIRAKITFSLFRVAISPGFMKTDPMKKFLLPVLSLLISAPFTSAAQPNVLIIYADDMGYGDLGIQNPDSKIPTPNFDRLAKEGMRFTDGHSSSGICTPSRYALLTGRHHWRDFHGIVNAMGDSVFKPERLTLPEMLKAKGYTTAAIGKWHLGWNWAAIRKPNAKRSGSGRGAAFGPDAYDWNMSIPNGPLAHGFDHYFGDTVINFPPYCWIEDDKVVDVPDTMMDTSKWKAIKEGSWECRPGPMHSSWNPYDCIPTLTKKAVEYIHEQKDNESPFFLYFAFPSPHAPIIPNDQFDGKSKAGPYGDFVYETDDAAGQLLKALKETGLEENTLVIFSADNGPEKYAYTRDQKFDHWSAKPFRGLKRDIYEGGHHVPYVIKWPGVTKAGSTCDALVSQIDIMATLADIVDYKLPDNSAEDSHNLVPLLKGSKDSVRETHVHNTKANSYAMRHKQWILVADKTGYVSGKNADWEAKHDYPADDKAPVELFNFKNDPGQRTNVASKHPEVVGELQSLLKRIREQGHSAPRLEK
jgi:arylsulfatase A